MRKRIKTLQVAPSGYRRHAALLREPDKRCARARRDEALAPQGQRVWPSRRFTDKENHFFGDSVRRPVLTQIKVRAMQRSLSWPQPDLSANCLRPIGKTLKWRMYPDASIGTRTMEVQMDPLKVLFSMCRSPRYGFHASEPSLVERNHHTSGDDSSAVGHCHGHSKPDVSPESNFLHLPEPDEELLSVVGEKMVGAARASGQPITLVVLQVYDLPEVELVFGKSAAEEVIDEVMTQLTRMAARKGFVVRSEADTFALLVPGMNAQATVAALGARFGRPCAIEFELEEDEILLVPDVKVHTLAAGESLQEVYTRVCRLIARERGREQLRCEYLRSEREAHTPVGLLSRSQEKPRETVYYPLLPATIPVPIGAR